MIDPVAMASTKPLLAGQDFKAAVAAVAGERDQHGGQGNSEGKAAGDLDVDGEQQHDHGMSRSPPATPIRAAAMPMPTPAASPNRVRETDPGGPD
jgi:hypothetical protein